MPSVVEVAGATQTAVITTPDTVTAELLTLAIVAVPGAETIHILEGDNPVPGVVEIPGPTQAAVISVVSALTAEVVLLGTVLVPIDAPVQIVEAGTGVPAASRSVYNTRDYPAEVVTVPAPDEEPSLDWYGEYGAGNHVDGSTYEVAVTYAGWSDAGSVSETMLGPSTSTVCENGNTLSVLPLAPLETRAVGAWIYIRKDGGAWKRSGSASDNQDKIIGFGDDGFYGGVLFDFRAAGAAPPGSNTAVDSNGDPIDDPVLAPTVTRIAGVDLDTYYGAYSYVGADLAETALSPISDPITVTDRGSAISFRLPELTPSGVCFVNIYLSTDAGVTWHKQGASQPWDFVVHYIQMYDAAGAAPSPGTPQSTLHEIQRAWDAAVEDGGGIIEFNPTGYPSDLLSPLHFRGRTAGGTRVDGVWLISHGGHSTNPIARGRLVYGGPAGVTAIGASASNCIIEGLDLDDPDGLVKVGLALFDVSGGGSFSGVWRDSHVAANALGGIGLTVLTQHQSVSTHAASEQIFERVVFKADAWGVHKEGNQALNFEFINCQTRTSGNSSSANSGEYRLLDAPVKISGPPIAANGQYIFYITDIGGGRADLDLGNIYMEAKHAIQAIYFSARAATSPRLTLRESYLVNQTGEVNLLVYAGAQNKIALEHNVSLTGDIQFGGTGALLLVGPDGNPVSRLIGHPTPGYQPLSLGYSAPPILGTGATTTEIATALQTLGLTRPSDADAAGNASSVANRAQEWGLAGAWKLADLFDSYGTNDLTNVNAATFNTGHLGNAVYLVRASTQHLDVADNPGLSCGDQDFLWAIWFWLTDKTTTQTLISKDTGGLYEFDLYYHLGSDRIRWYLERSGGSVDVVANTFGSPSATAWHLALGGYDSIGNLASVSIDGGAWDSSAFSGGVRNTAGPVQFGVENGSGTPINGRLDAAHFFKAPPGGIAAVQDEIRDFLWNGGTGREFAGPWG